MKFCWATINVKNLDESLEFYENIVGLKLERRANIGPGKEIAFLAVGETKVELIHTEAEETVIIGNDISLGFTVDSVDEKIHFLKEKGISLHSGPFQPVQHIKYFFIQDPNGLRIQFVEER